MHSRLYFFLPAASITKGGSQLVFDGGGGEAVTGGGGVNGLLTERTGGALVLADATPSFASAGVGSLGVGVDVGVGGDSRTNALAEAEGAFGSAVILDDDGLAVGSALALE